MSEEMSKVLKFFPTLEPVKFWGEVRVKFQDGRPVRVTKEQDYNIESLPTQPLRPTREGDRA